MATFSIKDLAKLLETTVDKKETNYKEENRGVNPGNLGSFVNKPNLNKRIGTENDVESSINKVGNEANVKGSIWNDDEVEHNAIPFEDDDDRMEPNYEILYKQSLTSDDVFLGLGRKDPSTACCECLLVKISLPGIDDLNEITLDVQSTTLKCTTQSFYLGLHLPHKVKSKDGNASWDRSKHTLSIDLPMIREYDCINLS